MDSDVRCPGVASGGKACQLPSSASNSQEGSTDGQLCSYTQSPNWQRAALSWVLQDYPSPRPPLVPPLPPC